MGLSQLPAAPEFMKVKGLDNRKHIIEAAKQLFYQQGFNQTSFTEIADAAGIPRGNFYYYFKTKDDILAAVIDDRIAKIRTMLAEWETHYTTPRERLHRFISILLNSEEEVIRYGCPVGSLNAELSKTQLAMQSKAKDMFDVFLPWLTQQFAALGQPKKAHQLALHLLATTQGISLIANVYGNTEFLRSEAKQLKKWVDDLG